MGNCFDMWRFSPKGPLPKSKRMRTFSKLLPHNFLLVTLSPICTLTTPSRRLWPSRTFPTWTKARESRPFISLGFRWAAFPNSPLDCLRTTNGCPNHICTNFSVKNTPKKRSPLPISGSDLNIRSTLSLFHFLSILSTTIQAALSTSNPHYTAIWRDSKTK